MPILVSGGDSQTASQKQLAVFALCSLIDKREQSKKQLHLIGFSLFCCVMGQWAIKVSLGCAVALLCISVVFMLYSLYNESKVLRQVQRELLQLLRDVPQQDIDEFFSEAVNDLNQD